MEESKELQLLQEWAPLTYITEQIKREVRIGFSSMKQHLTCIDFTDTHISVGSDCGVIYWCPRSGLKPRELRLQEFGIPITAIRIGIPSKECNWIATGDKLGSIHVFQISTKHSSEDRVYHIPKHHKAAVTTLEWSDSGDTLFSGDEIGIIKTCELLFNKTSLVGNKQMIDEQYKIIQLSFKAPNFLLASTLHRAVIIKNATHKDYSIQRIGKKARASLMPLGGILTGPDAEPLVLAARPRQKLWIADINGDVIKTLIFTNLSSEPFPEIKLINTAVNFTNSNDLTNVEFNRIEKFTNNFLVVSHHHGILILDTDSIAVTAALSGLHDIKNVAVFCDEIMFLEGNFNIVRLGWEPDPYQSQLSGKIDDHKLPVGEALIDISTRLKHGALSFVPILTATFQGAKKSSDQVSEADEASELPTIVSVDGVAPLCVDRSTVRCVQPHEFENIALAQKRIRRKKPIQRNRRMKVSSGVDSGSDSLSTTSAFSEFTSDSELSRQPSLTNMALEDIPKDEYYSGEPYIPADIKPDLRNLDAISADVSSKEKILEESLHLNDVILSFRKTDIRSNSEKDNENAKPSPEFEDALLLMNQSSNDDSKFLQTINSHHSNEHFLDLPSVTSCAERNSSCMSTPKQHDEDNHSILSEKSHLEDAAVSAFGGLLDWDQVKAPESLKWFCVSENFILAGGKKMNAYVCDRREKTISWKQLDFSTSQMFMSPKGSVIWKLDVNIAYELRNNDLFKCDWRTVSRNVTSVSLSDFIASYICDNQLYLQTASSFASSISSPAYYVPSPLQLAVVSCYKLFVWVLSEGNKVQRREGVSKECLTGNFWVDVVTPDTIQVKNITAGPNYSGWISSTYNNFYFTKDCSENVPTWFQLLLIEPLQSLRDPIFHMVDSTLWIAESDSQVVYHCDSAIEGEEWHQLCEGKWKLVSAGGIFVDCGSLWLCSESGRLYQTYPHSCSVMQQHPLKFYGCCCLVGKFLSEKEFQTTVLLENLGNH
nr:PREDICTED: tectonin beta-propeller repeat-containing protein 2 isoform X2 [Bemisia tabaci]XP_018901229.1 PREDICTED: tectonin beta-propeller repeat-containing protein 2 isoform X2 [Bemisia tabaci]